VRFDRAVTRELFSTFILSDETPEALAPKLQSVIDSARASISEAISDNKDQIKSLNAVSSAFVAHGNPQATIERLQAELAAATSRAEATEARLGATSRELESIRTSLTEAERKSRTDALTGLANRGMLDESLREAMIKAMESGTSLSVFMIDIDHFKSFNDQYGHLVGDQVLRLVAKVMLSGVRESDIAARYGGEELMVVLPGADAGLAGGIAERVRQRIGHARITRRSTGEDIGNVTVSIGVTEFRPGEPAEAMISRCDAALYRAKRAGRNQTIID